MFKTFIAAAALASVPFLAAPAAAQDAAENTASSIVQHGTFKGLSDHDTSGGVSILKTASGYVAVLESDFSLDGAPSPTLGFGNDGFEKKTEFTKLESKKGLQIYTIPASVNPADYDEFYVWCAKFSVPLGVADLSAAR